MITAYVGRHRSTEFPDSSGLGWTWVAYVGCHRDTTCVWCDGSLTEPVRDEQAVAWLGDSANTYCSADCLESHAEQRINAAGNEPL